MQDIAERFRKRHAIRVFEVMNDLAKGRREKKSGAREIEVMLAFHAEPAQTFDRGRRFSAFHTKGRIERKQARPAFRTCPSPFALQNRSMTMDTRDWEQEVEDVVEQSAFWGNAKGTVSIANLLGFAIG